MLIRVLLCLAILFLLRPFAKIAGTMATEAIEIDRIAQKNPRQAAAEAQLALQQATLRESRPMQLRALRILASAH